jgi:COP9 signalosome complex subunit 3
VINPALNSVPYVYALLANINAFQNQSSNALDGAILWDKIAVFLENFDPIQIRYVGLEFREVVTHAANLARRSQQVCIPIRPRVAETWRILCIVRIMLAHLSSYEECSDRS